MQHDDPRDPQFKSDPTSDTGSGSGTKTGMGIDVRHAYALLVGVGQYQNSQWSIPVAARDVKALHEVLIDPDRCAYPPADHVRTLCDGDATADNLSAELDRLAKRAEAEADATVLVYFSGHGWVKDGRYFLVTHETEPYDIPGTAFPAERFTEALRRIRPRRLLVMLDTCHAEHMAEAKDGEAGRERFLPPDFAARPLEESHTQTLLQPRAKSQDQESQQSDAGRGRAVLTSCTGEQKSWFLPEARLSLFTQHLIEALEGQGSPAGAEAVRVTSLMQWVSQEVAKSAKAIQREQVPVNKYEGTDFAVAPVGVREAEEEAIQATKTDDSKRSRKIETNRDYIEQARDIYSVTAKKMDHTRIGSG